MEIFKFPRKAFSRKGVGSGRPFPILLIGNALGDRNE